MLELKFNHVGKSGPLCLWVAEDVNLSFVIYLIAT